MDGLEDPEPGAALGALDDLLAEVSLQLDRRAAEAEDLIVEDFLRADVRLRHLEEALLRGEAGGAAGGGGSRSFGDGLGSRRRGGFGEGLQRRRLGRGRG